MKSSLALTASPLLLLLLLLDSTSSLPLADPEDGGILLKVDPRVQLVPVIFEINPDSSVEVEEDFTGGRPIEEEALSRKKRQTIISGGVDTERLGQGGRRDKGHINIGHTAGKHTITGGATIDKVRIPGVGRDKNVGVNVGYVYRPNKNTAFSLAASRARGGAGRSSSFGLNFSHQFGRK